MFLFAVGYSVGPQFVRGVAKDGLPQAIFSGVQCALCLGDPRRHRQGGRLRLGLRGGAVCGSQTISASMGLATDAINRLGMEADKAKAMLDGMPVAYAVSYMFGTLGSALVIALLGPKLPRNESPRGLQGIRREVRGHQRNGRPRLGLASVGVAGVPGEEGREGRWPSGR